MQTNVDTTTKVNGPTVPKSALVTMSERLTNYVMNRTGVPIWMMMAR